MRLICLNIWGGRLYDPLIKWIAKEGPQTDIFCLQEVFESDRTDMEYSGFTKINIKKDIEKVLSDFECIFHPLHVSVDNEGLVPFGCRAGQAIFVKKNIKIIESGVKFNLGKLGDMIFGKKGRTWPNNIVWAIIEKDGRRFVIANTHGIAYKEDDKEDDELRAAQREGMLEYIKANKVNLVFCGDFNLNPWTESIKEFSRELKNLISEYNIPTTRSIKSVFNSHPDKQLFADYTFVSNDIKVKSFEVPDPEISDHNPMILEIE